MRSIDDTREIGTRPLAVLKSILLEFKRKKQTKKKITQARRAVTLSSCSERIVEEKRGKAILFELSKHRGQLCGQQLVAHGEGGWLTSGRVKPKVLGKPMFSKSMFRKEMEEKKVWCLP